MAHTVKTREERRREWNRLSGGSGFWYSSRWGGIRMPMLLANLGMPLGQFFAVIFDPDLSEEDRAGLQNRMKAASNVKGPVPILAGAMAFMVTLTAAVWVGPIPGPPGATGLLLASGMIGVAAWLGLTLWYRRSAALPDHMQGRVIIDSAPMRIPKKKDPAAGDIVGSDVVHAADHLGSFENRTGVEDDEFDKEWRKVWDELTAARKWAATPVETPRAATAIDRAAQQSPHRLN